MAGATTNGIPYPTGSDRVMDGDNAMQAMAEKIDPSVAATSGVGSFGPGCSGKLNVFRRGRVCHFNFEVTSANGTAAGFSLGTLPVGFRPVEQWFFQCLIVSSSANLSVELSTAGGFVPNVTGLAAGGRIIGSVTFPLPPTQA